MLAVTFSSLGITIRNKVLLLHSGQFTASSDGLQLVIAVLLLVLGVLVAVSCAQKLLEKNAKIETAQEDSSSRGAKT
jgi:carbon starvation protein